MSSTAVFWAAVAALAVLCLAATATKSLAQFSPHALKDLYRRRGAPDRLGQILRFRDRVGLAAETLQVAATATFAAAAIYWAWLHARADDQLDWLLAAGMTLGAAAMLLTAAVWLPRAIAGLWAEALLCYTWPLWRVVGLALTPLAPAARFFDVVLHRLAARPPEAPDEESFEEDIRTIVSEGHREGLLEEEAREMIEGVMELSTADVARVMTPRTDMLSLPASLSWPEVIDLVIQAGHTRTPVYGRSRDDIVGILYAKDLLPELAKPPGERVQPWTRLLRAPLFVPETKPIDALLREFQRSRHHMAVVLDEYGGVSGLVTLEDVLEEIVGEIVDEYDAALVEGIRDLGNGACEALGRVHLDEINERLGVELPDDAEYDTIGGLVFSELGHVPVVGEELRWRNVRVTVLEATRRRIERVRVEVVAPSAAENT
jgi:CBS domain containing-hemolysin-like protein